MLCSWAVDCLPVKKKALWSLKVSGTSCLMTQCHVLADLYLQDRKQMALSRVGPWCQYWQRDVQMDVQTDRQAGRQAPTHITCPYIHKVKLVLAKINCILILQVSKPGEACQFSQAVFWHLVSMDHAWITIMRCCTLSSCQPGCQTKWVECLGKALCLQRLKWVHRILKHTSSYLLQWISFSLQLTEK
jgi:hypothetical protein